MASINTIKPSVDSESEDAEKVNLAMKAIASGDDRLAETKLLAVIARTPREYRHVEESSDAILIRFWDQEAFIHYMMWHQSRNTDPKNLNWVLNAYPRAYYYLGFLSVKRNEFDKAIRFLACGAKLEPTNPLFQIEKAHALIRMGRKAEALAEYQQVKEVSEFVSPRNVAMALRGCGCVLIEMNELYKAELAFRRSLDFEPGNEIALNELRYIDHLRTGGSSVPFGAESVGGFSQSTLSFCGACGQPFEEGVYVVHDGNPVAICSRCKSRLTKKWWQFWK